MCFSWEFIKQVLILAIVVVAIIGILQLVIPFVISKLGASLGEGWNVVIGAFRILVWAVIAIIVVIICFDIIACLWSYVGGSGSLLPHR